jgi:hypothetical protein
LKLNKVLRFELKSELAKGLIYDFGWLIKLWVDLLGHISLTR